MPTLNFSYNYNNKKIKKFLFDHKKYKKFIIVIIMVLLLLKKKKKKQSE